MEYARPPEWKAPARIVPSEDFKGEEFTAPIHEAVGDVLEDKPQESAFIDASPFGVAEQYAPMAGFGRTKRLDSNVWGVGERETMPVGTVNTPARALWPVMATAG